MEELLTKVDVTMDVHITDFIARIPKIPKVYDFLLDDMETAWCIDSTGLITTKAGMKLGKGEIVFERKLHITHIYSPNWRGTSLKYTETDDQGELLQAGTLMWCGCTHRADVINGDITTREYIDYCGTTQCTQGGRYGE